MSVRRVIKPIKPKCIIRGQLVVLGLLDKVVENMLEEQLVKTALCFARRARGLHGGGDPGASLGLGCPRLVHEQFRQYQSDDDKSRKPLIMPFGLMTRRTLKFTHLKTNVVCTNMCSNQLLSQNFVSQHVSRSKVSARFEFANLHCSLHALPLFHTHRWPPERPADNAGAPGVPAARSS